MVSSVLVFQAGAASAEKGPSRVQRTGAALKRAGAAAKKFVRDRVGLHPNVRQVTFGAKLKLLQGDVAGATTIMKHPGIVASGGTFNFRERRAVTKTQKKINKAWKKEKLRELGPGVPEIFNRPAPVADERPMPGQYL
ncbi:MAG TPA: hypothetical protein VMZ28_09065 [Kofleriaceae bacterium]|nr:hypothetical protein [Kofleriaceae bacterium]